MKYATIILVLAILFSHILTINPNTQLIGDGSDNHQYFGFMYLVKQNIDALKHPFAHTSTFQYPVGFDLSFGFDGALPILTGALLGHLVPLPFAFNIVIILILWANCYIGYICFKKIGYLVQTNKYDAYYLIPAVLFGWSPYVFGRLNGHINLSFIAGFPILAYAITFILSNINRNRLNRFRDYLLFFGSFLVIAGGSLQYLIQLAQIFIILLFVSLLICPKSIFLVFKKIIQPNQLIHIAASSLIVALPFFYMYYGYFYAFITHQFMTFGVHNNSPLYIPSLWDFIVPNSYLGIWWSKINPSAYELERIAAYGIVGNICILFFIFQNKLSVRSRILIAIVAATVIFGKYIPFLLIPEPSRVFVGFSLLTAIVISSVQIKTPRVVLLFIIVLLIGERFLFRIQVTKPLPVEAGNIVKSLPGKAVLQIPLSDHSRRASLPYVWDKSIVDGALHYPAKTNSIYTLWNNKFIHRFICNNTQPDAMMSQQEIQTELERLYKLKIQTIVLHKQGPGELWWFKECYNVRTFWNTIMPDTLIDQEKNEVITHKFEYGRQAPIHSKLVAKKGGILEIVGMTLWPSEINDFALSTQEGSIIRPAWKLGEDHNLVANFNPPLFITLKPRQQLSLLSNKTVDNNTYVSMYYQFIPNNLLYANTIPKNKYTIDFVWKNDDSEIYSIVLNK